MIEKLHCRRLGFQPNRNIPSPSGNSAHLRHWALASMLSSSRPERTWRGWLFR